MAEQSMPPEEEPVSLESDDGEEEPIRLVDEEEAGTSKGGGAVKAFGAAATIGVAKKEQFSRDLNLDGSGATRCRIFHSKIQDSSLEYMENQINEWLDSNQIEVKQVCQVIGVMEGKRAEPNVIITVWY